MRWCQVTNKVRARRPPNNSSQEARSCSDGLRAPIWSLSSWTAPAIMVTAALHSHSDRVRLDRGGPRGHHGKLCHLGPVQPGSRLPRWSPRQLRQPPIDSNVDRRSVARGVHIFRELFFLSCKSKREGDSKWPNYVWRWCCLG